MVRKLIGMILVFGLAVQLAPAQSASNAPAADSAQAAASDTRGVLTQVQALIRAQAQQLEGQRLQLERQQAAIEELRREVAAQRQAGSAAAEQEQPAASAASQLNAEVHALSAASTPAPSAPTAAAAAASARQTPASQAPDSPLSIRAGSASITPGGWADFTAYYRSTDVGSGLGTSFASIPFNNTVQGGLSEVRFTAQSSRITLRADESFGATKVFGYGEADFNGYLPSNAYVSTNSGTPPAARIFHRSDAQALGAAGRPELVAAYAQPRRRLAVSLRDLQHPPPGHQLSGRPHLRAPGAVARGLSLHSQPCARPVGGKSRAVQRQRGHIPRALQQHRDRRELQYRLRRRNSHAHLSSGRDRQALRRSRMGASQVAL